MTTAEDADRLESVVNPPVWEAIFDVQVELPLGVVDKTLQGLAKRIEPHYPNAEGLWKQSLTLTVGSVPADTSAPAPQGVRCRTPDGKQVVQFRLDGFTFSRLRPYTRWKDLYPQAQELWRLYRDAVQPKSVTRVATRFINVIEVPKESVALPEYLTAPPDVPKGLPQNLEEFLYRVVFKFPQDSVTAIVTQASRLSQTPGTTALLLDVDVFRQVSLEPSETRLWETFDRLHDLKNEIFDRYLQPKAMELFK